MTSQPPVDATLAADGYLEGIPVEERRSAGMIYTPEHLVEFILDQTGYRGERDSTLLDPACGGGAFLSVAASRIACRLRDEGVRLDLRPGRARLLRELEASLYGMDVDPQAIALTRNRLRAEFHRSCGAPAPDGFLRSNLVCGDFLLTRKLESDLWSKRELGPEGFSFIVGNPPYVAATRLSPKVKLRLRRLYQTAWGRVDLYVVFMERAAGLLVPGGRMGFITPDKFLTSQTAKPLRDLLLNLGAIKALARFRSHKLFKGAATVPCVTVYERGAAKGSVTLLECTERSMEDGTLHVVHRQAVLAGHRGRREPWRAEVPRLSSLADRMRAGRPLLKSYLSRLSAGTATGRDSVYCLGDSAAEEVEPELLRPAVRGRDLQAFRVLETKLRILVPYAFDGLRPELVGLRGFPRTSRYLRKHRGALESRHCVRVWDKPWYALHDPVPLDLASTPKILVPDVARSNRFVLDSAHWPLHSVYYLLPTGIAPEFLTTLLNSLPIEFLIRLRAPIVKDGFSRYRKQFLEDLPVAHASTRDQATLVIAGADGDWDKLNQLAASLYGLTQHDLRVARRFLEERSSGS